MARTPQNPRWHGEGDVWTHTRLVCQALAGLADFRAMEPAARDALALAALLHDIGKAATTRLEDGAWCRRSMAPWGRSWREGCCGGISGCAARAQAQRFREAVCLLIRFHTRPLHLIEGDRPQAGALKLAASGELAPGFTLAALCLLSEADVLAACSPITRSSWRGSASSGS